MNQNNNVKNFIEAVLEVCRKFNYSISHEDGYGAFEIEDNYSEENAEWLRNAFYHPEKKDVNDETN